jgi:hypothetical protein
MAEGKALYGDSPTITAGGAVKILVEGDKGAISVDAGGDVSITVFSLDNLSSSLAVQNIETTGGNVIVIAPHGITGTGAVIEGNRIELDASAGTIAVDVDSNLQGTGGVAARAQDGVTLRETAGDLRLLRPTAWASPTASIIATAGSVVLETTAGSIRDAVYESVSVAAAVDAKTDAVLQQQMADAGFAEDRRRYALSPGLMSFLYPHAPQAGSGSAVSHEFLNVSGIDVSLLTGAATDQIGQVTGVLTVTSPQLFENLTPEQKQALSRAGVSDIRGVSYELYEYLGADGARDLADANQFVNAGQWRKVTTDHVTGTDRKTSQTVSLQTGQTVRVQSNAADCGLYRFLGTAGSRDLSSQDYSNATLWLKLTADHATDDGTVLLETGQLVASKFVIESLTLQVWDDVNVAATGLFAADAQDVAVQSDGSLRIDSVLAGGDVRIIAKGDVSLEPNSEIIARAAGSDIYVEAGGVLHVEPDSAITSGAAFNTSSGTPVPYITGVQSTVYLVSGKEMWIGGAVTASRSMNLVMGSKRNDFADYFDTLPVDEHGDPHVLHGPRGFGFLLTGTLTTLSDDADLVVEGQDDLIVRGNVNLILQEFVIVATLGWLG